MRKILAFAALAALVLALFPFPAAAEEGCPNSVHASVRLRAHFVTLPDAPVHEAVGAGELCYTIGEKGATVMAASVPRLIFHGVNLSGAQGELSAYVDAMPGVDPVIAWPNFPEVTLSNVDLRVRAFKGQIGPDGAGPEPLVDVILPRLSFRTGPIEVEGVEAMGFIDGDTLTAQLVGSATLPDYPYEPYAEWLAGQPVLMELVVEMQNPYKKD